MTGGLLRGPSHEDAAKFSFPPAISQRPGVLNPPSLTGPAGAHIHGQVVIGFLTARVGTNTAIRTLTPFAAYCLIGGSVSTFWFSTHRTRSRSGPRNRRRYGRSAEPGTAELCEQMLRRQPDDRRGHRADAGQAAAVTAARSPDPRAFHQPPTAKRPSSTIDRLVLAVIGS